MGLDTYIKRPNFQEFTSDLFLRKSYMLTTLLKHLGKYVIDGIYVVDQVGLEVLEKIRFNINAKGLTTMEIVELFVEDFQKIANEEEEEYEEEDYDQFKMDLEKLFSLISRGEWNSVGWTTPVRYFFVKVVN
jgi:lipoate-protein ligase A